MDWNAHDMHWPLDAPLREGLRRLFLERGARDRVVVCGTAYVTQPEFCEAPFEELIASIPGLGHLDVLVAGGVYARDFKGRLPVYAGHRDARAVARDDGAQVREALATRPREGLLRR